MGIFDYFKLKTIFETETPYNGKIKVLKIMWTVKIATDDITQSINIQSPIAANGYWKKAAELITKNHKNPKNILFLGLGGGTTIHYLAKKFPKTQFVCVEIDAAIIDISKRFFGVDKIKNLQIVNADAFAFVKNPQSFGADPTFDVIFADMFRGNFFVNIPNRQEFLTDLSNCLNNEGFLIFNYTFRRTDTTGMEDFVRSMQSVFDKVVRQPLRESGLWEIDNHMIYGIKRS